MTMVNKRYQKTQDDSERSRKLRKPCLSAATFSELLAFPIRLAGEAACMVAPSWKDGECAIARKVGPDRACKMPEMLDAIRLDLSRMSKQLREAAVQADIDGQKVKIRPSPTFDNSSHSNPGTLFN
jgi:hypothetical protein